MARIQRGFTLIEIAIVLVIIGLLLGGVLKGQELITSARVRNLISMQDGIKAAYFGFLDRYRALPGDYSQAAANINGVTGGGACGVANAGNGNGDGQILAVAGVSAAENVLAWEHLSKAGFINGSYTCTAAAAPTSNPTNPYGQYLDLVFDSGYAVLAGGPVAQNRHILTTGGNIGSDVLAEIDRKIDDGNPAQGSYRGQTTGTVGAVATCFDLGVNPPVWITANPGPNCGGATIY
jgi:prepilin-type N-terminal cleavage/methylation domain-containing protein